MKMVEKMATLLPNMDLKNPFEGIISDELFKLQFAQRICYSVLDEKAIIGISDEKGIIKYANRAFCTIAKYSNEELLGNAFSILNSGLHPRQFFKDMWADISVGKIWRGEICNKAKDGSIYWVDTTIVPVLSIQKKIIGYASIRLDISERKEAEARLTSQGDLLKTIKDGFPGGLAVFGRDLELIDWNDQFQTLMKIPDTLIQNKNTTLQDLIKYQADAGELGRGEKLELVSDRLRMALKEGGAHYDHAFSDGSVIEVRSSPLTNGGWVRTYVDVTEARKLFQRAEYLASHDSLTALPNRREFQRKITEFQIRSKSHGLGFAILLVDLDGFKHVNDSFGHHTGDDLLTLVSGRIGSGIRATDLVARIGGDEFAIIADDIKSASEAENFAERVISLISRPYELNNKSIKIGASIGAAIFPQSGKDAELLMRKADIALYRAKNDGRGKCQVFDAQFEASIVRGKTLARDLERAIQSDQFALHYQPQIGVSEQSGVCFEALLRWKHPVRGMIAPATFIPIAEECGLIEEIGQWVIRNACEVFARLPERFRVAINVSPQQIQNPRFLETVDSILTTTGIRAERLEIEVTEGLILRANEVTKGTMRILHELGITTALDDFGTGYSSLTTLQEFRFDKVKIDRSFISQIPKCQRSLAFLRAIVALSKALGMKTTAEGVETRQQLSAVIAEGCSEVQGYVFGRPQPIEIAIASISEIYKQIPLVDPNRNLSIAS